MDSAERQSSGRRIQLILTKRYARPVSGVPPRKALRIRKSDVKQTAEAHAVTEGALACAGQPGVNGTILLWPQTDKNKINANVIIGERLRLAASAIQFIVPVPELLVKQIEYQPDNGEHRCSKRIKYIFKRQ